MDARHSATFRSLERAVSRALLSPDSSTGSLQSACETLVDSERYDLAWLDRFDPERELLVPVAAAGVELADLGPIGIVDSAASPSWTDGTVDDCELRVDGEPAEGDSTAGASDTSQTRAADLGRRSIAVVPLYSGETLRGVLHVGTDRKDAFGPGECAALDAIAGTIACSLDDARPGAAVERAAHATAPLSAPGSARATESDARGSSPSADARNPPSSADARDSPPPADTHDSPPPGDASDSLPLASGSSEAAHAQRAVLERELRTLDGIVATVDDGIYALDADSRFTMVNDAYCELVGYDRVELLGAPASLVHSEAIDAQVTAEMEAARSGTGTGESVEITVTTADGEAVPIEARVAPFEYADGSQGRVGVVRDVTERKRRERELEEYRTITEAASDVIVVIDESSVVRSVNPALSDVFGYEPDELLGEPLTMLMSEAQSRAHAEGLQRYLDTGERTLDWNGVELVGQHADGHDVQLSVSFSEYECGGEHRFAGVIRDVTERSQYERALSGLHGATRDLVAAESVDEVADRTLDAATDVLEIEGVGIYLFDDADSALRPAATTEYVRELFGDLPTFGPGDTAITWEAFLSGEPIAHDDVLESDAVHSTETPLRSGVWIPLGEHGVLAIVSERAGGIDDRTQQLADHLAATTEVALDRIAREEALREHEQTLAERNRRLEELDRMNAVIREIDQELVRATTKADIEQAVCDRLTADGRFAFAWIGGVENGAVVPRTSAGDGQAYLDDVPLEVDSVAPTDRGRSDSGATVGAEPAVVTAAADDVTVVSNVSAALESGSWRRLALSRGLQSAIAVPIQYGGMGYGVLTVYADVVDAFDDLYRTVLAELGETIGNAMNAVETERALLTDSVVELELAFRDADDPLVRLVETTGCTLDVDGIVPQASGASRLFVTVHDVGVDAVGTAAERSNCIEATTLLDQGNGEHRFELTVPGRTIPGTLVACGAATKSVHTTSTATRAVVELPHAVDVRTFVDRLEGAYPDAELVARRDVERGDSPGTTFETELTASLTDRQLEALQTAYLSGYFEWPRDRTGEEVAASLDITQSTFNGHLRAAERKLLAQLFERSHSSS